MQRIVRTWWPLAGSWLLMAAEVPALSAVVARLPDPSINLAAYGGVVFPLALIVESPILMLLSASTALSKDWASYRKIWRFMMVTGAVMTAAHVLMVFTPLYYVVVRGILGVPEAIVEPARIGLMIMIPWTWAIAYRRFHQGVLIRFGHSRSVGAGTAVRLGADGLVLLIGYTIGTIPGIVVASSAVIAGVISEAVFIGLAVRPVLREDVRPAPPVSPVLTWRVFFAFYIPLALTSLISLLVQPIGSAGLSRMPDPIASLAVWPVVTGLLFLIRSLGFALNEVVVALLDERGMASYLRQFTGMLATSTTALLLLFVVTPLAGIWFGRISALPPHLAELARTGLWLTLPIPALTALQSWCQGSIVNSRRTRGITEAVVIYLFANITLLWMGVAWGQAIGLYVGLAAFAISTAAQTAWLWWRSRPALRAVAIRDAALPIL
jgi:progressive ankylosis protein